MKFIKGVIFGVDVFNGLCWFILLTVGFKILGLSVPSGFGRFIALCAAVCAAILPDLDWIPYTLIRKDRKEWILLGALVGFCVFSIPGLWLGKLSFTFLGFACLYLCLKATDSASKVKKRASHWPIWHHPMLLVTISAILAALFAYDFVPNLLWYCELLVVPLVIAHFLHDGMQRQGFPYFSPFWDAHFQWHGLWFERVLDSVVYDHYRHQVERSQNHTNRQDAEVRLDKVTQNRIALLMIALGGSLAVLLHN